MPSIEELLRAPRSLLCLVPRTVHTEVMDLHWAQLGGTERCLFRQGNKFLYVDFLKTNFIGTISKC